MADIIDAAIQRKKSMQRLSISDRMHIRRTLFNEIRRLDIIQSLMEDSEVTEIMVNGPESIFYEKKGRLYNSNLHFESKEKLFDIIQRIVSEANRVINTSSPIVDARLKDGSRVNVVLDPVAINGPILTIRRFPNDPIDYERLVKYESVTEEVVDFLKKLVTAKYNILISGGTGAGKTTFLNVMSGFIPCDERIITIEDSAELKIQGIDNLVSLESRNANYEGCNEITIRDLIKTALRMRPDRIIVGEVRGSEAIDMLQAFNVGEDGSMSTIHANSAYDALSRLETMMLLGTEIPLSALRRQMSSGIDIIVQLGRLRDKSRRLLEIIEVIGFEDNEIKTNVLYEFEESCEENGMIIGTHIKKNELLCKEKLMRAGIEL